MATSKEEIKKEKTKDSRLEKVKNPEKVIKSKKKVKIIILVVFIIAMILAIFFSVIFAFVQRGRNTIVRGVSAKGVELSNLTVSDAKEKMMSEINNQLKTPIKLTYDEYSLEVNISELEFSYKVDEMLDEAYKIGRTDDILKSNYSILFSMINGKELELNYSINEVALENIISTIDSNLPGKTIEPTYDIEEKELVITPGKDGIGLNEKELKKLIIDSIKNRDSSIINKYYQEIKIPVENKKAEDINIDKIYGEVHCEPKDAYLIKEPFELVKDVDGIDFAISIEEAKNLITGDKEEYIIPLKITPASKTVADLGEEAFPHVLSTFKTNYNAGDTSRTTNLRIAANKINGTVLLPGEEFSFNKVVGKRTVQDGYQNAAIYENGKVVDGLAGGICQISTTLYNAVLYANLEVVSRRNHNFTSTYVDPGRDATVVYGAIDFVFKNSRQYPIKIVSSVSGGVATFQIKGIKEETEYEVKIYTSTTAQIPFSEEVVEDSSVPAGTKQVVQGGHNGLKVSSYKALLLNGREVSRELIANDTYKVMNRIVKVPVGTTSNQGGPSSVVEDLPTSTESIKETPKPEQSSPIISKPVSPTNTTQSESTNTNSTDTTQNTTSAEGSNTQTDNNTTPTSPTVETPKPEQTPTVNPSASPEPSTEPTPAETPVE